MMRDHQLYPHKGELTLAERLAETGPKPVPFYEFKRMTHSWKFKFGRVTFIWCQLKHTYKWMLFWG